MTASETTTPDASPGHSRLFRAAIWVAIGALIAAAVVCVVWVFVGGQNGIIGRAFLTILLLAAFGGVSILDARLAPRRAPWFALLSMVSWVLALLIGAFLIWVPEGRFADGFGGFGRFVSFLGIVLVLQLAVLHVRLYSGYTRSAIAFNRIAAYVTLGLVAALAVLLVLPLLLNEWLIFTDLYGRLVVAVSILAAVGTAIVPLVNALFAPRRPTAAAPAPVQRAWPTYADGVTPLPYLPDGSPDWNALQTGQASPQATAWALPHAQVAAPAAPVAPQPPQSAGAPGYEGVRPAPPLPPQS